MACEALLQRIKKVAIAEWNLDATTDEISIRDERVWIGNQPTEIDWLMLIHAAYTARVSLSEHAHYATPQIHFDWTTAKGHPFAYHVYGTCVTQVTLDVMRGTYTIDFVKGIHDFGKPMNQDIDMGQIEGGIVQGIGWMTMEEILYDTEGKLKSNALSTYKIPDVYSVPGEMDIRPLPVNNDNLALLSSKAVGEPPLMYGIGVYFAIRDAIRAFRDELKPPFDAPYTPERVLLDLYPDFTT
jgi:xanthine dehydrogenase large subunit